MALKIGSTTGYTRDIMAEILPVAAAQGFAPDSLVCTGDTPDGRPTPFMLYGPCSISASGRPGPAVKVDDTEVGIAEGLNGGCWTVGVAVSGNVFGLSLADTQGASAGRVRAHAARGPCSGCTAAGAHYVIDSVADLLPVVDLIEGRLARGERP